jgi:hypothetical protein
MKHHIQPLTQQTPAIAQDDILGKIEDVFDDVVNAIEDLLGKNDD